MSISLDHVYPGQQVIIDAPCIHLEGRVEGVFHVGRPEQTRITVWGDQCGGILIIPEGSEGAVTIEEVEQ